MGANQDLMAEYLEIVKQLEHSPRRDLLARLFDMVDLNFAPAMHTLSVCFENGIGVKQSDQAAFDYCKAAASLKNPAAMHNMGCNYLAGKHVERDAYKALAYFNSAAKAGYVMSAHCSGWLHDNGEEGVERNAEGARLAYEWAFRHGYAPSANNLGIYYLNGRHVAPDPTRAEEWLRKAAAAGCHEARENLAKLQQLQRRHGPDVLRELRSYVKIWLDGFPF